MFFYTVSLFCCVEVPPVVLCRVPCVVFSNFLALLTLPRSRPQPSFLSMLGLPYFIRNNGRLSRPNLNKRKKDPGNGSTLDGYQYEGKIYMRYLVLELGLQAERHFTMIRGFWATELDARNTFKMVLVL